MTLLFEFHFLNGIFQYHFINKKYGILTSTYEESHQWIYQLLNIIRLGGISRTHNYKLHLHIYYIDRFQQFSKGKDFIKKKTLLRLILNIPTSLISARTDTILIMRRRYTQLVSSLFALCPL